MQLDWSWKRAYLVMAAVSSVLDVGELFRNCSLWDDLKQSQKFWAPEDSCAEDQQKPAIIPFAMANPPGQDFGDDPTQLAQNFHSVMEAYRQGSLKTPSPPEKFPPAEEGVASSSSGSARTAGVDAVRRAGAGSQLFNMSTAIRWESWFTLSPEQLDDWERGMLKQFVGFSAAELPHNSGAAAESKSLIQATRLLMNQNVSMEVRLLAFAYHSFVRLTGNAKRMAARAISEAPRRAAALEEADKWIKEALGFVTKHPMEKEVDDKIHSQAGFSLVAAGLAAVKGGFASARGPPPGGRGRGQWGGFHHGPSRPPFGPPPQRGGFSPGRGAGGKRSHFQAFGPGPGRGGRT